MAHELGQLGEWLFLSLRREFQDGGRASLSAGAPRNLKAWLPGSETWKSQDTLTKVSVKGREHYPDWRRKGREREGWRWRWCV